MLSFPNYSVKQGKASASVGALFLCGWLKSYNASLISAPNAITISIRRMACMRQAP